MKRKSSQRRVDVNVDEFDRIIDAAMWEPLTETDGRDLLAVEHDAFTAASEKEINVHVVVIVGNKQDLSAVQGRILQNA